MGAVKSAASNKTKAECRNCACFENDPALIEETYKGLSAMSSGFGSARDEDGLCNRHSLYLSARDSCPQFTKRS
jgi:hypothetical protein